jgi:hypothetical protein
MREPTVAMVSTTTADRGIIPGYGNGVAEAFPLCPSVWCDLRDRPCAVV